MLTQQHTFVERSRKYYFSEFDHDRKRTMAQAEHKLYAMKSFWGKQFVSGDIVEGDGYLQVVVVYSR